MKRIIRLQKMKIRQTSYIIRTGGTTLQAYPCFLLSPYKQGRTGQEHQNLEHQRYRENTHTHPSKKTVSLAKESGNKVAYSTKFFLTNSIHHLHTLIERPNCTLIQGFQAC